VYATDNVSRRIGNLRRVQIPLVDIELSIEMESVNEQTRDQPNLISNTSMGIQIQDVALCHFSFDEESLVENEVWVIRYRSIVGMSLYSIYRRKILYKQKTVWNVTEIQTVNVNHSDQYKYSSQIRLNNGGDYDRLDLLVSHNDDLFYLCKINGFYLSFSLFAL
jgi:hypothetical protein